MFVYVFIGLSQLLIEKYYCLEDAKSDLQLKKLL